MTHPISLMNLQYYISSKWARNHKNSMKKLFHIISKNMSKIDYKSWKKYGAARFTTFLSCMHKLWHPEKMSFSILCYYYIIEIDNVCRFSHLQHRVIYTLIDSSQSPFVPLLVKNLKKLGKNSFWVWIKIWSNPELKHMYIVYIQPD